MASRNDIYDALIGYGIDENMAYLVTEDVRKGKICRGKSPRWPEQKAVLLEHGVPGWFIWSCEKICYMFPRAHAYSYVMNAWRMAWYKLHFPLEFFLVMLEVQHKTTTAINLAKGLADAGKRVLLIDADPQGNATAAVGFDEPDMLETNLATALIRVINDEDMDPGYGIITNECGFDILPRNIELSELEVRLVNTMDRGRVMKQYITMVRPFYDFIIIDCAPSLVCFSFLHPIISTQIIPQLLLSSLLRKGLSTHCYQKDL